MDLHNQTVLVTGASKNIGAEIAKVMAEAGADVGITAHSNQEGCEKTAQKVREYGNKASIELCDLSDPAAIEEMVASIQEELGPVDILAHNASIRPKSPLLDIDLEEWDHVQNVNLRSAFLLSKQVIPDMIKSGGGSILFTLGSSVFLGTYPAKSHVFASKSGLIGLTTTMASEFGRDGIRVNAVSPGPIDTDRELDNYGDWEENNRKTVESNPLGRRGTTEEVANTYCFLASDYASYITGQIFRVNGGMYPSLDIHKIK